MEDYVVLDKGKKAVVPDHTVWKSVCISRVDDDK